VICLDCGFRGKTLRRHISKQHGLSRDEYRQRWGLRSDHPLTAPAYSEQRSTLAKEVGLGRKPKAQVADAAKPVVAAAPVDAGAETQTAPSLRRRSRSKQADVVSQAVAAQPPSRRRERVLALLRHNQIQFPRQSCRANCKQCFQRALPGYRVRAQICPEAARVKSEPGPPAYR